MWLAGEFLRNMSLQNAFFRFCVLIRFAQMSLVPFLQKVKTSAITPKGQSEDFMTSINNSTKG
jgi:hypothetical protein